MSGTKLITPTSIALDEAGELVQEQIDDLEDGIVEMNCDDTIHLLKHLKKDILARKPVREPVRSTIYTKDMDNLSTMYEKGREKDALDNLTPEEEEERKRKSMEWLDMISGPNGELD